jgi:cation-transporting ATPase E
MENNERIDFPSGLTYEDALRLKSEGKVNVSKEKVGKSYLRIICDNLFTYFNLIWLVMTLLLVALQSFKNLTFLAVVIPNTLVAMILEIKAKRSVEKLSVTTEPKAVVIRDGKKMSIDASEIVLGDVMYLELGRQILSDAVVLSGLCEVNESMLTGESDAIKKEEGARLLAGSFLVSGSVYARVTAVGRDNYVHKIESAAKNFKAPSSNLFRDLTRLVKVLGIALIPLAAATFLCNYLSPDAYKGDFATSVIKTCGSVIGMIPSGMFLLVTLTLSLSVITLAKKNTLVQDMYSIEMLASADVLCLDKTGTITDGTMQVQDVIPLGALSTDEICKIMAKIEGTEESTNNTSSALIDYFGRESGVRVIEKIPFSSKRKYSAVDIEGVGAFSIGAPHFIPCPVSEKTGELIENHASCGKRVLLLAKHENLESFGEAVAVITISDRIRVGAIETIRSFTEQGVTLKVISGDHAKTVSAIAERVDIRNADKYVSCENLSDDELISLAEEYTVFGRVSPEQKVLLVKTLKSHGHTVAMTGDGVNDTLALKESNCAIAMAEGSEMACKVSHIVLTNSNFTTLPDVVNEGRRCINNVRGSSVLFLMKTFLTVFLIVFSIFNFSGYPFEPSQFTILELLIIGLASLLLAVEPNRKRIEGSFIKTVLSKSLPKSLPLFIPVLVLLLISKSLIPMELATRNSIAIVLVIIAGYVNLFFLCMPFNKWRTMVASVVLALTVLLSAVSILLLDDMLGFTPALNESRVLYIMSGATLVFSVLMQFLCKPMEKLLSKLFSKR